MTDSITGASLAVRMQQFQQRFGVRLENSGYLAQALVISDDLKAAKRSGVSQHGLESIGDGILTTVVRERMLVRFTNNPPGFHPSCDLLLSNRFLAEVCRRLQFHRYAEISPNHVWAQITSEPEHGWSQQADLVEALIGAIYMGASFEAAKEFVLEVLWPVFVRLAPDPSLPSPQGILSRYVQEKHGVAPIYRLRARLVHPVDKTKVRLKVDVSANQKILATAVEVGYYNAQRRAAVKALTQRFGFTNKQIREQTSW